MCTGRDWRRRTKFAAEHVHTRTQTEQRIAHPRRSYNTLRCTWTSRRPCTRTRTSTQHESYPITTTEAQPSTMTRDNTRKTTPSHSRSGVATLGPEHTVYEQQPTQHDSRVTGDVAHCVLGVLIQYPQVRQRIAKHAHSGEPCLTNVPGKLHGGVSREHKWDNSMSLTIHAPLVRTTKSLRTELAEYPYGASITSKSNTTDRHMGN